MKTKLRSTNNIKRGSDNALTESSKSGTENKIDNVPRKASPGKDDRCLKVSVPPKYTIMPNIRAFTKFASIRGSFPIINPKHAKRIGYRGEKRTRGTPV